MIDERLRDLDIGLFGHVLTQLRDNDKQSLLALHAACRDVHGSFGYLEIGSYQGGSLQPFVVDPRCERIVSIDPRPETVEDLRGAVSYSDNTTLGMFDRLGAIPGADVSKLVSLEASTAELDPEQLPFRPQLCLIDGEHTDEAAFRDALFCLEAIGEAGCIVFDDPQIVYKAIRRFTDRLEADGTEFRAYLLPYELFVVELGEPRLLAHPLVQRRLAESWRGVLMVLLDNDEYRLIANGRLVRLLRRVLRR